MREFTVAFVFVCLLASLLAMGLPSIWIARDERRKARDADARK